jgi:hypothetical protein
MTYWPFGALALYSTTSFSLPNPVHSRNAPTTPPWNSTPNQALTSGIRSIGSTPRRAWSDRLPFVRLVSVRIGALEFFKAYGRGQPRFTGVVLLRNVNQQISVFSPTGRLPSVVRGSTRFG